MTLSADQPLPAPADYKVFTANKRYYAFLDAKKKCTTAFQASTKSKLWEMRGWYRVAALADDGEHMITGYDGGNLIPMKYDPKMVMLTFYRQGKPFKSVTLRELLPDLSKLRETASNYSWGVYAGFEGNLYRVDTEDGRTLHFDPKTGEAVRPRKK